MSATADAVGAVLQQVGRSQLAAERMVLGIVGSAKLTTEPVTVHTNIERRRADLQSGLLPVGNLTHTVHAIVGYALGRYQPDAVVSGGAAGVDTIARTVAESFGYQATRSTSHESVASGTVHEFVPRHNRWSGPGGFRYRNLIVAGEVTHLLAIRWEHSTTYGSGWTADRAEQLGKPVLRVTVPLQWPVDWPDW